MMLVGTKILETHENLVKSGFSATFAAMLLAGVGIIIGLITVIAIGLLAVPKPKAD